MSIDNSILQIEEILKFDNISPVNLEVADYLMIKLLARLQYVKDQSIRNHYLQHIDSLDKKIKDMRELELSESNRSSLDTLKHTQQELKECEELGKNIINNLDHQNNQIKNLNVKTNDINQKLTASNVLLSKMKRWFRN